MISSTHNSTRVARNRSNDNITNINVTEILDSDGRPIELEYIWVTDPNRVKVIERSLVPESLLIRLKETNESNVELVILFSQVLDLIQQQIENLNSDKTFSRIERFPKGYRKYTYQVKYDTKFQDQYQMISDWINLISYPALSFRIDQSKLPVLPGEREDDTTVGEAENIRLRAIDGLRSVIESLVRAKEKVIVRSIIQDDKGSMTILTPHDEDNRLIYLSPEEENSYQVNHPLDLYYGWRYLSDNPLTLYVISQTNFNPPIREVEGLYLIPSLNRYNAAIDQIRLKIPNLISQQYLTLNLDSEMDNKLDIYQQLLTRFGHQLITPGTDYVFTIDQDNQALFRWCQLTKTCSKNDQDQMDQPFSPELSFKVILSGPPVIQASCRADQLGSLPTWFDQSVHNIIHDGLPMVRLTGIWQDVASESKYDTIAKLKYASHLAYHDLVITYPYLSGMILLVKVNDDLSIIIPVTSSDEIKQFKDNLNRILGEDYTTWSIFHFDQITELIAARLILIRDLSDISTWGVKIKNRFNLVTNRRIDPQFLTNIPERVQQMIQKSSTVIDYYSNHLLINDLQTPSREYVINRSQLLGSYRLVNRTRCGSPELADLSDLIGSLGMLDPNQISLARTCQSGEQLNVSLPGESVSPLFLNPITSNPITEKSLSRAIFYPKGWMGLFDVNFFPLPNNFKNSSDLKSSILPGIYNNPPARKSVPIQFGEVKVEGYLPADTYQTELILTVNLTLQSKNIPLFDISYHRLIENENGKKIAIDYTGLSNSPLDASGNLSKAEQELINQVQEAADWLWKQGWFLTSWGAAILSEVSSEKKEVVLNPGLIRTINMLKGAHQDQASGERAIEYLNQTILSISIDS